MLTVNMRDVENRQDAIAYHKEQTVKTTEQTKDENVIDGVSLTISEAGKKLMQQNGQTENIAEQTKEKLETMPVENEDSLKEMYQMAKSAAIVNARKKHKDYDSMFEEETEDEEIQKKARDLESENDSGDAGGSTESGESIEAVSSDTGAVTDAVI
ncbi:MAG: hypothetical protein PHP50_04700 [Lachnospiraceae bacterium]|nr:hypothetical protein [Lachnospiraceae bacterium]